MLNLLLIYSKSIDLPYFLEVSKVGVLMLKSHDPTQVLVLLMGGSMLLLYGVKLVTDAMERALGSRLRLAMMTLGRRPLGAFVLGAIVTMLTQSSTATASVIVGLVSAQLLPLAAATIDRATGIGLRLYIGCTTAGLSHH
ncbi:hypothetical protein [Nostoc sp.]|uniref:hypothetical protein n=1 Tax=Nostoc sp. TaxID=1180 RepID=UPI002FF7295E